MKRYYTLLLFLACGSSLCAQTLMDCDAASAVTLENSLAQIAQDTPFIAGVTYTYCVDASVEFLGTPITTAIAEIEIESSTADLPATVTVTNVADPTNPTVLSMSDDTYTVTGGTTLFIEIAAVTAGEADIIVRPLGALALFIQPDTLTVRVLDAGLPVVWSAPLTYRPAKSANVFSWSVASQFDVASYTLQYDVGEGFVAAAVIPPLPTEGAADYALNAAFQPKDAVFRVLQTDYAGTTSTSNLLFVPATSGDAPLAIYPNPATDVVTVRSDGTLRRLTVRDMAGRIVLERDVQGDQVALAVSALARGVYTVTASGEEGQPEVARLVRR